jgi:hypothetical protein
MLQKPRTLGSVTPELLSHSFAPHFEAFFGVFTAKIQGAKTLVFALASIWNGTFGGDRHKPPYTMTRRSLHSGHLLAGETANRD